MRHLYTIGFTQISLEEFIGLLRRASVDAVIDTRLRNTSQLAGWAKRDDLAFLLREGFGIAYEHIEDFAPSSELLDAYRTNHDWASYAVAYRNLLSQRAAQTIGDQLWGRYRAPCLLCSEPTPEHCHRRLLAEYLAEQLGELSITHLIAVQKERQARSRKARLAQ